MIAPGDVRPSHPAPNVRDDREPPLLWVRDRRKEATDLGSAQSEIFFQTRLDDPNRVESPDEIAFYARHFSVVQVVRTAQHRRKSTWSAGRRAKSLEMGQSEEKSVRVYVFRFALKLGHSSTQPALRIGANNRHPLLRTPSELDCSVY